MVAYTLYPDLAKASVVSSPIPLFAPVIITDFICFVLEINVLGDNIISMND
jgi:hypothetical protein